MSEARRRRRTRACRRSRHRPSHEPALARGRLWLGQRAGGIVVPVLTAVVAFLIGGIVVARDGAQPAPRPTATSSTAPGLNWFFHPTTRHDRHRRVQPLADAAPDDDADPHRARGRVRVPLRDVQHRRPGPVLRRPARRELDRLLVRRAWRRSRTSCSRSSAATLAGAVWAGIAGFLKATVGAHEVITTIMLNWIAIWVGTYLFGDGGPLQNTENASLPISNDVATAQAAGLLGRPGAPGPPHRLLRRDRARSSSSG